MKNFRNLVDTYVLDREKHKKHLAVVLSLSMLVTFAVPLSLMQPAESMTANKGFMGMPLARATVDDDAKRVELLVGNNSSLAGTNVAETIRNADATYALGIASQFCVFLQGNYDAYDSDAEGRVAVGGNINNHTDYYYNIGLGDYHDRVGLEYLLDNDGFAHVITGDESVVTGVRGTSDYFEDKRKYEDGYRYDTRVFVTGTNGRIESGNKTGSMGEYEQYEIPEAEFINFDIDFDDEFDKLKTKSEKLYSFEDQFLELTKSDDGQTVFIKWNGPENATEDVVYCNLSPTEWENFKNARNVYFQNIPKLEEPIVYRSSFSNEYNKDDGDAKGVEEEIWEHAFIVINVESDDGADVHISNPQNDAGHKYTYINDICISNTKDVGGNERNNEPGVTSLLYNFPNAGQVVLGGAFQGTIFAPNAKVTDEKKLGNGGVNAHLSGAVIAQSFEGHIEFGYRPYTGPASILGSTSGYTIPVDKFKTGGTDRLPGADFKLTIFDQDDNVVTSWTSGDDTEYVNIPTMIDFTGGETYTEGGGFTQSYTVKEESAPEGYVKTNKEYTITVSETVNEIMTVEDKTIPTNVTVNLTFTASDDSTDPSNISFTIQDIYKDDAQIRRKIIFNDAEYWLEIENQKVTKIVKPGETITSEYPEDGTTYYLESIQYTTTKIHSSTETETSMITSVISNEESTSVTEIVTNVPKTEVQTEMVVVTDTYNNPVYGNDGSTSTEPKVISSNAVTGTSVEYGEPIVSYYEEAKNTTYTKTTEIRKTETFPEVPQPPTKGTVTIESKPFYFDPDSLMLMPMPSENLSFTNDYGFVFKKVDEGDNLVTGATIILEKKKPDGSYTEEKQITASSITLDPAAFNENTLYRFRESVVPDGYEEAMPIYLVKIGKTILYIESETEPAMPTAESHDGWTEFAINAEDDKRVVSMTDQKIHGVKLKLYKSDADNADKVLTNTVFSLYPDGSETPIKTGITIADGKDGFDFYEAFKNETENEYIKNGYLVPGTYYLEETDPPDEDGYEGNAKNKYYFTVKSDYTIEVGKPDAIPINIQGKPSHPTQIYFPCDASGTPLNGEGATIADVIAISFKVRDEVKTHSNIGELNDKVHSGSTLHTKEFSSPQTLTKLEFQTTDWNRDVFVEYVEIQTKDGKKYVYKASESGGNSGNTGGDSGNTGGDSGNTGGNTGGNTSGTQTVPEDFPNAADGNITIINSDSNPGKIWYPSDANGNTMNQDNWNGSVGIANVTSVRLITNNPPKIYSNAEGYKDGKTYDTTDTTITFNSAQSISKFEIQPKNWNDGIEVYAIAFTTSDGKQYIYRAPSEASTLSLALFSETPKATAEEAEEESDALEITQKTEDGRIVLDIPNKYSSDFNITVEKLWDVKGNNSLIPNELTLTLERKKDGGDWETYSCTPMIDKSNNVSWTYKYNNLPVDDGNGKKYYYRIQEKVVPNGYEVSYSENVTNGVCKDDESHVMTVTNTLITTSYEVKKTWNKNGADVTLPDSIEVKLQYSKDNGTTWMDIPDSTQTLTGSGWTYTYTGLPSNCIYRAVEVSVPAGWNADNNGRSNTSNTDGDTLTLTNTYQTAGLKVAKKWLGDNDSNRPENVTVLLYRKAVPKGTGGGATVTPTEPTDADGQYDQTADYSRLLQYSLYFYDANMCGTEVESNSAVSWRGDCHTGDSVPGGFHDAGDHVMYGLAQGFSASTLGWTYYEFGKDSFDELGLTEHYRVIMDEFCRFFKESTKLDGNNNVTDLLWNKSDKASDHGYWGSPESQNGNRPMYWTSQTGTKASDVAAEYAATLALNYLNFGNEEDLKYAKALYQFSMAHNSTSPIDNYPSGSCDDDQAFAAGWLYLATEKAEKEIEGYTDPEKENYKNICARYAKPNTGWVYCWDQVSYGAACAYAHITGEWSNVINALQSSENAYACTNENSYYFVQGWGSARHNTLMQLVALAADKNNNSTIFKDWATEQMAYILGKNPKNTCYVTGFDVPDSQYASAQYPHHRAASGYQNVNIDNYTTYDATNGKVLVGALVGGPSDQNGSYNDSVKDYQSNEVALDYNAGLVGAAAGLYSVYGTGTLADSLDDFPEKSGIETLYPAASPLTVNAPENQKANAIKGISQMWSGVKAKGTLVKTVTDATGNTQYNFEEKDYISDVSYVEIVVSATGQSYNGRLVVNNHEVQKHYNADADNVITITLDSPVTVKDFTVWFDWKDSNPSLVEVRFYTESSNPVFTISPAEAIITAGEKLQFTAENATGTITWSSSNSSAATVDQNGEVTAGPVNTPTDVTITAIDNNGTGAKATAKITINPIAVDLEITPNKIRSEGKATITNVTPAGASLSVHPDSENLITLDGTTITSKGGIGTAIIQATVNGITADAATIEIVGELSLAGEETMNIGEEQTLTVNNSINIQSWTSSDTSILTVENGVVKAIKDGTATITVKDSDGAEKSITISVELTALLVDTTGLEQVGTITITKAQSDSGDTWTKNVAVDVYNNPLNLSNLPLVDAYGNKYEYYIAEQLDPSGDNTLKTPTAVYVPVSYDGNGLILNENDTNNTITVGNKLKSSTETTGQMPSAGGRGTDWYYIAGAAMMLAGLAGYFVLKRRQRSRAEA